MVGMKAITHMLRNMSLNYATAPSISCRQTIIETGLSIYTQADRVIQFIFMFYFFCFVYVVSCYYIAPRPRHVFDDIGSCL
jgi:hypothetical protein